MADANAQFSEAKEAARQRMLEAQAATAKLNEVQATDPTDDDDDPTETPAEAPDEAPEEPDDEETETDDESSDDDEDDDEEEDDLPAAESDQDPDDEEDKPQPKRKPSRRSKKINKLQSHNDELQARLEKLESERDARDEQLLTRFQEEQARRVALEAEQRQREADDRALEAEMAEYLGTDEEYASAVRAALRGDAFEAEKANLWNERREIVGKLNRRAEARVNQKAAEIFWTSTEGLTGVDKNVVSELDFGGVLKYLHQKGYEIGRAELQKEVDKRDAKIARLEAQNKQAKVKTAVKESTKKTPLEGGSPVPPKQEKSIYEQSMRPDGTIDRAKFDELRRLSQRSAL